MGIQSTGRTFDGSERKSDRALAEICRMISASTSLAESITRAIRSRPSTIGLTVPRLTSRRLRSGLLSHHGSHHRATVIRDVLHRNNGFTVVFQNAHTRRCYVDPGHITWCGPHIVATIGVRERTRYTPDMPGVWPKPTVCITTGISYLAAISGPMTPSGG